jgi:ArsR family transcriptional regulator
LVIGRKEGLWVYYRLARPKAGLHRILLGCLDSCLGDPEVFRQDRQRLERAASCCGDEG